MRAFGDGPPLVAFHGFTHTGAQFAALAELLPFTVLAPDLPGHGATTVPAADLDVVLAALGSALDEMGPAPLVGYSQGGRLALLLALARPDLIAEMTLLSASPGLRDRAERRIADLELAARIESLGIDAFLDGWLRAPLTATTHLPAPQRRADRAARMENTAAGLAAALRGYGQGAQPYVMDRLGSLTAPVTFMAGGDDARYAELAVEMAAAAGQGRHVIVPGAGHNLLLDAAETVAAVLTAG